MGAFIAWALFVVGAIAMLALVLAFASAIRDLRARNRQRRLNRDSGEWS